MHEWDTDKDGRATYDEIAEVRNESEATVIMGNIDEDKDGGISYDELQDFYESD